jgi:hypothetical protein
MNTDVARNGPKWIETDDTAHVGFASRRSPVRSRYAPPRFPSRRAFPAGGAALRARLAPLSALRRTARVSNTVPLAYAPSATRQETEELFCASRQPAGASRPVLLATAQSQRGHERRHDHPRRHSRRAAGTASVDAFCASHVRRAKRLDGGAGSGLASQQAARMSAPPQGAARRSRLAPGRGPWGPKPQVPTAAPFAASDAHRAIQCPRASRALPLQQPSRNLQGRQTCARPI